MSNLLNIYNENFGQHVVTNGNYIAVSNTNSKPYSCNEGFARLGEVLVYQKNRFTTNYSFAKTYRRGSPLDHGELLSYYTEQSASSAYTASLRYESGSLADNSLACDFLILEDGTVIQKQTSYGSALAICERFLVISDIAFSQSIANIDQNYATVDIYKIYDEASTGSCSVENDSLFSLPNSPFCGVTGSAAEGFGRAVAVSNNFLAISSPFRNSNRGAVDIYLYTGSGCGYYTYYQTISSSNGADLYFGSSVYIDKYNEDRLVIASAPQTGSKVFVYFREGNLINGSWELTQTLTQDTSSKWLKLQGDGDLDWLPISQSITRYGYSVAIAKDNLIVGAPNDLIYYEYSSSMALTGSQPLRQRGAIYYYNIPAVGTKQYVLLEKIYGDTNTFKDNMFGYSVDINGHYVLAGSPKPYFPFSSLYLSSSVNRYNINFETNDFGASTFNGQAMLYKISTGSCDNNLTLKMATTTPIGYRKKLDESFTAFGASVALSDLNLVIGSPAPLNDDLYLSEPYAAEQSGSGLFTCNSDGPSISSFYFRMEDEICGCDGSNLNATDSGSIVLVMEQDSNVTDSVFGRAFIYDFGDLQTNPNIGNIFYSYNKFVVNNTGSILSDILKNPLQQLDDYIYGEYQSQITLHEKQYICTVEPGEFNISTNPTAVTASYVGPYCVINKETFDFSNLDIILRYINYKLTTTHVESWWDVLVSGDVQESIFGYFSSSMVDYTNNRLTPELKCELATKDFDVNKDGMVNYADAYMIWNYFIENLTVENYQQYITPTSRRKNYDDIISFLDKQTGKGSQNTIKAEFFDYNFSSSVDPTGSYLAPYITQVGLYAGADLVAVGKIATPIKNNGQIPINIVVKWDT
jgi:hypothetical protein